MLAAVAPAGDLTDVALEFRAAATALLRVDQDGRGDFNAVAVGEKRAKIALFAPETHAPAFGERDRGEFEGFPEKRPRGHFERAGRRSLFINRHNRNAVHGVVSLGKNARKGKSY